MRSQPDAAAPHHPCQKTIQNTLWAKSWVMLVSPANTLYCFLTGTAGVPACCLLCARPPSLQKNNTKCTSRLNLDHARPPRDPCQVVFERDGGGAGIWPGVCRPTRHRDGHPAAIAHWFSTRMVGADMVPMCAATCAGAPGTLCACPERGAPDVPGTLGPQVCLARVARLARVAHLAPASRTWGWLWFTKAVHPKTIAEHAEARVLLICWEGGWE